MRKLWLIILAGVVVAGGAALAARQIRPPKPNMASVAPDSVPVVAGTVVRHDVPIYRRGVGTVIAYNNVIVRSQITGQLIKIAFTQGQTVKKAISSPRSTRALIKRSSIRRSPIAIAIRRKSTMHRPI